MAGIHHEGRHVVEARRVDQQDVGAVLGERAPVRGAREDASQVEHTHAVERTRRSAYRLGLRLPDLLDLDAGDGGQRSALVVRGPLVLRPHHRATGLRLSERIFEHLRIPLRDGSRNRLGIGALRDGEHSPSRIGEPRERSVQVHPAPVAALVQGDQRVVGNPLRRLTVEELLEDEAQQRGARRAGCRR